MKCLIFAYSQLGYDCLKYLIERTPHTIAAVVTHDDNPNEYIWFDSVKKLATSHSLTVLIPTSLKNTPVHDQLAAFDADVIFSFYYRNMIPETVLSMQRLGAYNIHGSLLPKYRGRCPVNWAILHGETETGITLHHMVKAADAGDIVDQAKTPIAINDTAGTVTKRLNTLAVDVLARSLSGISTQTAPRTVQDTREATYFGGRTPHDGAIDWTWPAKRIHNLIRALQPSPQYPAAFGVLNGKTCTFNTSHIISQAEAVDPTFKTTPGTIILKPEINVYHVSCGLYGQDTICVTASMGMAKQF